MKKLLSVVTPFYCSSEENYLNERIDLYIQESYKPDWMERIIVDFGSPTRIAKRVQKLCEKYSFKYINLDKGRERFSAGKCRNIGAQVAEGEYISFSDLDLFANNDFYEIVYEKINKKNNFNYFEVLPCFYLTEEGSKQYLEKVLKHEEIYSAYMEGDESIIKMAAPATSCFLMKKDFYLSEGGMRDDFFGHGYEDFELMNRLAIKANKFYRSHSYYSHEYKYDSLEYKGYRTFFSLFGRENMSKGIYYVHIYHEPAKDPGYKESSRRNKKIFEESLLSFDKKKDSPPALDNILIDRNVLMLGWKNGIPFKGVREVIPYLGKTHYRNDADFNSVEIFHDYLKSNNIDFVFFLNPYGNEQRLSLYKFCKENNIGVIIYDRGALPNSWFFDTNGFNAESESYSSLKWDNDLSENQHFEIERYTTELCTSDATLEDNGERIGSFALKKKYGCNEKKIIFVPLQRPNDTVIKYFSGSVSGVEEFIDRIKALSARLSSDWVILIKQHPLESYELDIPGCIVVDQKTHVHDLIEASDAVLLINSGVGLISLCFGKPVYCLGQSFYAHEGLANRINSDEDIFDFIERNENYRPNRERVNKFLHYLVNNFYSFAKTEYITVTDEETGSSRSVAVNLQFDNIRIEGLVNKVIERRWEMLSTKTPSYDYYRAYFQKALVANAAVKPVASAAKPAPKLAPKPAVKPVINNGPQVNVVKETEPPKVDASKYVKSDSAFQRKFRKLLKDPALFIKDAIK